MRFEGEPDPQADLGSSRAQQVWNMLADSNGGLNWSSLPLAMLFFEIEDIDDLIYRLLTIKNYRAPEPEKVH